MNVPQPANTRLVERFTELAIQTFLWAFRIVVVLVVVVGSFLTLVGGRYDAQTWINLAITGAALGSVYALVALGYTMVYGILTMINFAHGDVFMVGAFLCFLVAVYGKFPFLPVLALSMVGSAAAVVASFVWFFSKWREPGLPGLVLAFAVTGYAAALMVSGFSYLSLKQVDVDKRVKYSYIAFVILPMLILIRWDPPTMLFAMFVSYATYGPVQWLVRKLRRPRSAGAA
jgi:branched-subunit amino acid ABC-type transport system permease component